MREEEEKRGSMSHIFLDFLRRSHFLLHPPFSLSLYIFAGLALSLLLARVYRVPRKQNILFDLSWPPSVGAITRISLLLPPTSSSSSSFFSVLIFRALLPPSSCSSSTSTTTTLFSPFSFSSSFFLSRRSLRVKDRSQGGRSF